MPRPKKTAETHPITTQLVALVIGPVVEWCDEKHGRRAEFLDEFRKAIAPETVSRQVVESWISTDPDSRTEPMLGNGLAIYRTALRLKIPMDDLKATTNLKASASEP